MHLAPKFRSTALFVSLLLAVSAGLVGSTSQVALAKKPDHRCDGISHRQVKGAEPRYSQRKLARFAADESLCHGIWLPKPRKTTVPQSLAVSGHTGYLVGYDWKPTMGDRPCRVMKVDLRTGKRLAYQSRITGRVGTRPKNFCRHGGGIALQGKRLWVVEKHKLWLLDPARVGKDERALRVWRIEMPVMGSTVVVDGDRIGLVPFAKSGKPKLYWYSTAALLRTKVTDLGLSAKSRKWATPVGATRVPTLVQGAMIGPKGKLFLTRSNTYCGELVRPNGKRVAFIPGAEQIQLVGKRLWVVSESGAVPLQKGSKRPLTPAVSSFQWPQVLHGPAAKCGFKGFKKWVQHGR